MKIPTSFIPTKNLDDKVKNFLEKKITKSFDHVEVSIIKHFQHGRIKHFSRSYRRFESKFTDDLRMIFDYGVGQVRVVDVRVFEAVHEGRTRASTVASVRPMEYGPVVCAAEKKIKSMEEGFDFNRLKEQIRKDSELLGKLDDLLGLYPAGDYHFLVFRNGEVSRLMAPEQKNFSGADQLKSIYNEYIEKYLPSAH